jgi:hypothetical protein
VDEVLRSAVARRLDFIALTDHNTTSATPELEAARDAIGATFVLTPGMELTTYFGHANALGTADWIDWRVAPPPGEQTGQAAGPTRTMADAAADVHRRGGLFVINHPRSTGYPYCTGCRWEYDDSAAYADALEVWNGPWRGQNADGLDLWDAWLNAGHRVPAVAGSDGHVPTRNPEILGQTYVFARPEPGAILAAVRAGLSYLSSGPALVLQRPGPTEPLPARADSLVVSLRGLQSKVDVCLVAGGARGRRLEVSQDGDLTLPLPAEPAPWYRIEVYRRGSEQLLALTNPTFRA